MNSVTGKSLKIVIFLILTAILTVVFILLQQSSHLKYTATYTAHTNEVLYQSQKVLAATTENKIILRDFLLTGDNKYLQSMEKSNVSIFNAVSQLKKLTGDNASQQARVESLLRYINKNIELANNVISLRQNDGLSQAPMLADKIRESGYDGPVQQIIQQIEDTEKVLLNQRKETNQLSGLHPDNLMLWLIAIVLILVVFMIQHITIDFLTLKKAERKLSESQEQLGLILRNVKDYAIFTTDSKGTVLSWNEGAASIKGYSTEEITGKNISVFYSEDKIKSGEPLKNLNNAKENGHFETEGWRVKKDGSLFWANNVITALYDDQQNLKGFAKITKDITEQRKKQEEITYLSRLVEQTTDAIFSTDTNYLIKSWNRASEKLYGYTSEEAIGRNLGTLIKSRLTDEQRKKAVEELKNAGFYQSETEYSNKNDEPIFVLTSVTSIRNEDGLVTGYVGVHKDISERRKLEDQLVRFNEELEEKVRLKTAELTGIFDRISDAFIAFDKNWCYTYINKKAGELIRRDPASMIGKNVWAEFPDAVGSATYDIFHKAFHEQQYSCNTDYYGPFDLWHENHIYPSPEGISVFTKNITDKKKAEEKTDMSNERFQIIANATNDAVWDWDLINHTIWWNKNYYSQFEYTKEEITPDSSWYNGIHPDDRKRVSEGITHAIETGEPYWSDEYRFLKADGTPVFVLDRGYIMYDKNNKPFRMAGAMVDLTGIRKAEEKIITNEKRFRALLRNSTNGLTLVDEDESVIDISPSGNKILGYSYEELIGKNRPELIHADDRQQVLQAFTKVRKEPARIILLEYRHLMPDGSYKWLECSYNNLLEEPHINAIVLNYRDITERKNAEEKMRTNEQKSYDEIRQLASHLQNIREEERAHIAREIHDELGQQLTGLKMDISWLGRKKDIDEKQRDQKIKEILIFLDGTVNTVRKLSAELRPSILDDLGLVEALEWWSNEFEKRAGILCSFQRPEQSFQVPSNLAIGLFRIYQESLTNVARHANAKNVFTQLEAENNQLILKIADDGKGFDAGNIGHKKTLGLLGMKERTLMMGGSYEIKSEPGKGTTVTIAAPFNILNNI